MMAGDSHANWVSDLVWLDEANYNSETGEGSLGAEFGGTAVTSTGPCDEDARSPIERCNIVAEKANPGTMRSCSGRRVGTVVILSW